MVSWVIRNTVCYYYCYCYSMRMRLIYVLRRFLCLGVSPSSSGLAVAGCVRPRWSQSVGRTIKLTWTLASWSRRTAGPGAWAASPRNTTDPAARSGGRRRGTTSTNNTETSSLLHLQLSKYFHFLWIVWLLSIDCSRTKIRTKQNDNQWYLYIDP